MAPAKIMAVAVTKVKPKAASSGTSVSQTRSHRARVLWLVYLHKISGMPALAMDGEAMMLWKATRDMSPRIGFDTLDW